MYLAAGYSDQWFSGRGSKFNVFYCCRAKQGDAGRCAIAAGAKVWDRLRVDPSAVGQRWSCPVRK
eukprot:7072846-Lingulodinium_polyedra.AAC.1